MRRCSLIRVNGNSVDFVDLKVILDKKAEEAVEVQVWRGSQPRKDLMEVVVSDLSKITPNSFMSSDGAGYTKLSSQMAIRFDRPVNGVVRCRSTNNNSRCIIEEVLNGLAQIILKKPVILE